MAMSGAIVVADELQVKAEFAPYVRTGFGSLIGGLSRGLDRHGGPS